MPHGEHTKTTEFLRRVEYDWREATWHLRIKANLDAGLNFVLTLDEQIKKLLCVDDSLTEVCHETDQGRIPLV